MKVALISDVHLEFYQGHGALPDLVVPDEAELLICAGDLAAGIEGLAWLNQVAIPVIYTLGNHEFYHSVYQDNLELFRTAVSGYPNITLLEKNYMDVGNVRFLGAVLWTDFNCYGEPEQAMQVIQGRMSDFACIEWSEDHSIRPFYPEDSVEIFKETMSFYQDNLSENHHNVVISHHLPTPSSVPEQFVGGLLNPAFISDLDDFINHNPIKLWIHGHTHTAVDCQVGSTRVVANPHGYYLSEHNKQVVTAKLLDIS